METEQPWADEAAYDDHDDHDEDADYEHADDDLLADDARRRPGKVTIALAAGIIVAGAFGAGVLTQKNYDQNNSASSRAALFGAAGRAGGFGRQGFGAAGGAEGGFGAGGFGAGGTGGGGGSSSGSVPVVVGKVVKVSGNTITVENFAGTKVTVTVPDGATVATSTSVSKLVAGTPVSVSGSKSADGSVTATSVTAQK